MPLFNNVPDYARNENGFYEEDCEWSIVHIAFPEFFPDTQTSAKDTLKNYMPEIYEKWFQETVMPRESRVRDGHIHQMQNKDKYQCLSATGDWHEDVPRGFVRVFAGRGGRTETGHYSSDTANFLVAKTEYDKRNGCFIIDESRHQRIADTV